MNQEVDIYKVQNIVQFKAQYKAIVHKIVQVRLASGFTQHYMAKWLKIDRRKISDFEILKRVDIETLLNYAGVLSIEIKLTYTLN